MSKTLSPIPIFVATPCGFSNRMRRVRLKKTSNTEHQDGKRNKLTTTTKGLKKVMKNKENNLQPRLSKNTKCKKKKKKTQ